LNLREFIGWPKVEKGTGAAAEADATAWGPRGTAGAAIAARLTFENVERRYGPTQVLRGISLDIAPAEVVCLLGPSGCGKTTLLRIAAGIEKPSAGRVLINGQEASGPNRFMPPEQRSIGLMFQDFALFPHLTIRDNVAFGLKSIGKEAAARQAMVALQRVGLAAVADEYPHILSGGQQQRVALARAVAPKPSVLLMDEPFSGLDVQLRDSMQEETMALLRETRTTCIIVTHQPEEAMRLGDRIAVMREGRLVQEGHAEELYRHPADLFVARLFSEINEIPARVASGRVDTPVGVFDASAFAEGARVILCVRQGALRILPAGQGKAARVIDVRFLGFVARAEIAVAGLDRPLKARMRGDEVPPRGTEVGLSVDPSRVILLPGDASPHVGTKDPQRG
jgi:iron(III) transport system ATP-binding protein